VRKTPGYQYPDIAKQEGLCSLIALPLAIKKDIIGVLNCYTARPRQFTEEDISLLTALANQAALSIQNAKLMVQTAVLQEMHHRVKNSLQMIASLLRLQLRVGKFDSPREALRQSINRIQSIAAVHEMLSSENLDDVNLKKLAENILAATARGLLPDARQIKTAVVGEDFLLPSGQATYVALILNELIQNAVEHGLKDIGTELIVDVRRNEDSVRIAVTNDGEPLPQDFDLKGNRNLGLKIVESLVHDNLMGEFIIGSDGGHTCSVVKFPR
jgi:two-component sensor histidine kinase